MHGLKIPHNTCVLVGDGERALFLRNKGDEIHPDLRVERTMEQDNPPTHEQGTDRPGRVNESTTARRSAIEETDWHRLEKAHFARDIAAQLYARAHAGEYDRLIVVAPPRTLGDLRSEFHSEVRDRVVAEIDKDLTKHPIDRIEQILTAA